MTTVTTPWKLGDFHVIGAMQTHVGDVLCEDAGIAPGMHVLDIACGSGNTAMAAARRGALAEGIDIVDALIDRANRRAQAEGFEINYRVGDAQELPYEDGAFDAVVSTFGIMFAPDQERAANEALRVCKPGGTLAFASWVPESMAGALFAIGAKYAPPPPGTQPPGAWGTVAGLKRLFEGKVSGLRLHDHLTYARSKSPDALLATFKQYFGPTVMLYGRVEKEQHAELDRQFLSLYERYNRAFDGTACEAMHYAVAVMTKGTT